MNRTFTVLIATVVSLAVGACSHSSSPTSPKYSGTAGASMSSAGGSVNGAGGQMPAFYDGKLFTINSIELSGVAQDHIVQNKSHNEIYVTNDLDDPQDFDPVLDAIQGDGFNPLWEQIKIVFNPGVTPHQFFSDTEVEDAAAAGDITLTDTGELYRCSVVGTKK
jgi:hypothetical protein